MSGYGRIGGPEGEKELEGWSSGVAGASDWT